MDSREDRMRMKAEDRLSSLPDDLIHKILSFISLKQAIETSALSSRWRFIWTTIPYLDFSNKDFPTLPKFSKFCTRVLSCLNDQVEVSSVKLSFNDRISHGIVKRVMKYIFSHNVQQLTFICKLSKKMEFTFPHFISHSLKCLTLTGRYHSLMSTSTWELPAVTTLYLDVTLFDVNNDKYIDLLSKCVNLKNLTIFYYWSKGSNDLCICHPRLSNLTLESLHCWKSVNVVTPELENLVIRDCYGELQISAPNLASLVYKSWHYNSQLLINDFHSLEKVDLCIPYACYADAQKIVCLLQQFQSVKNFTLNMEIVELLSSHVELISCQLSPLANLNSLKIYPGNNLILEEAKDQVIMSAEVKNYLLDSSPSVTFTMVSRKEKLHDIRTAKDVVSARKLMSELRVLLDRAKAKSEANMANIDMAMAPVEDQRTQPRMEMQRQTNEGRMAQITSCWEDLKIQFEQSKADTSRIVSKLQSIEELLPKLPTSKRANMQAHFSSLCAEADIIMNRKIDGLKMQCDMKLGHLSVYFHEIATASQPSP